MQWQIKVKERTVAAAFAVKLFPAPPHSILIGGDIFLPSLHRRSLVGGAWCCDKAAKAHKSWSDSVESSVLLLQGSDCELESNKRLCSLAGPIVCRSPWNNVQQQITAILQKDTFPLFTDYSCECSGGGLRINLQRSILSCFKLLFNNTCVRLCDHLQICKKKFFIFL